MGLTRTFLVWALLRVAVEAQVPPPKEPKKVFSMAESIEAMQRTLLDPELEKIRKEYWKKTFNDIRNLTGYNLRPSDSGGILSQWKLLQEEARAESGTYSLAVPKGTSTLSDNAENISTVLRQQEWIRSPPRFEGFPSWERKLLDWSEEIQEYLDRASEDSESGYQFGDYGRPPIKAVPENTVTNGESNKTVSFVEPPTKLKEISISPDDTEKDPIVKPVTGRKPMPIPAPAKPGEEVLPHTDIADKSKRLLIVTTAALPWKTGTAVNPLLRAAYLTKGRKEAGGNVTLMLPWLERQEDQYRVYGANNTFETPADQEQYIRTWLKESADMKQASVDLKIQWYTAWQNKVENSIYSMGDITALVSADDVDICILEEPEHLNWYRAPGESWTKKFKHVVGVLHTNYFSYALDQPAALIRAPAMRLLCSWMCRAHCHRVIKLSGTLDKVAPEKELVENVHGVRGTFLDVGEEVCGMLRSSDSIFSADADPKVYFIGKMLWSKGLGSLLELLKYAEESANLKVTVDMFGGGPDKDAAAKKGEKLMLDMPFHGPLDHAELALTHKIFVNPSTSEVLCTTSAEALAMGKFVIIPSHPSNDFFAQFPNCLTYANKDEFVGELYYAMTHAPEPLTEEYAFALSWEAATQRLEAAGCIPKEEAVKMQEALSSEEAGIEITLPPLVESEEGRKGLSIVFRYSRLLYRQFRTRLSQEIQENKVLPKTIRESLVAELEKRLDLDIDTFLDSPKLRFKLSPAELDKSLLEFYDNVSESPGGDILRVIGGGGSIGLQNLYMRRHAERERWRKMKEGGALDIFSSSFFDDCALNKDGSVTQLVRRSLRRNLPILSSQSPLRVVGTEKSTDKSESTPNMCYGPGSSPSGLRTWNGLRPTTTLQTMPPRRLSNKFSILI